MLVFRLKKVWFDKIKSGEKTHEYRKMTPYWKKRIYNAIELAKKGGYDLECLLTSGYPSPNEKDRILKASIITIIQNIDGKTTDLKCDEPVFDIEIKLKEQELC